MRRRPRGTRLPTRAGGAGHLRQLPWCPACNIIPRLCLGPWCGAICVCSKVALAFVARCHLRRWRDGGLGPASVAFPTAARAASFDSRKRVGDKEHLMKQTAVCFHHKPSG